MFLIRQGSTFKAANGATATVTDMQVTRDRSTGEAKVYLQTDIDPIMWELAQLVNYLEETNQF